MSAVAGVLMLFVGLLMLWAFSAVLISILAGLTTSALLWLVLNLWRRRQLKKALAQNPALDLEQELLQPPALFYLLSALVIWLGCIAMLATLIHLPVSMFSAEQLSLGIGAAFWVALGTLIRLIGNLISVGQQPQEAANTKAIWSLTASLLPMLAIVVLIFFAPNTAGWMAWREAWRGYPSTQLRMPLKTDDEATRAAALALAEPLMRQGSRVISYHAQSRGGSSYTLRAAVPTRYRFHDGALEIQLAGLMPEMQLNQHVEAINMVAQGDMPDPMLLAYAQCQPSREKLAKSRFLSQGRDLMAQMQSCVHTKASTMRSMMEQLKGQLQPVQMESNWFNPKQSNWLKLQGWKALKLPDDNDALSELDTLR